MAACMLHIQSSILASTSTPSSPTPFPTSATSRAVGVKAKASSKFFFSSSSASSSANEARDESAAVELEFYGPDAKSGAVEPQKVVVKSGEKVLRNVMLDNKLELYDLYGKVMNCGGGGSCGTCIVEILEGNDLLSERTVAENRYLKKKPQSWRLACQTIVGDKTNNGKVTVQRLPQKKK